MPSKKQRTGRKVSRLSFCVEDGWWVAYFALDTAKPAKRVGAIAMMLVENDDRKRAFMDLMKGALGDAFGAKFGTDEDDWSEERARNELKSYLEARS